jgi:hypothetical protein
MEKFYFQTSKNRRSRQFFGRFAELIVLFPIHRLLIMVYKRTMKRFDLDPSTLFYTLMAKSLQWIGRQVIPERNR